MPSATNGFVTTGSVNMAAGSLVRAGDDDAVGTLAASTKKSKEPTEAETVAKGGARSRFGCWFGLKI